VDISVVKLNFSYRSFVVSSQQALKDITLQIPSEMITAIVGSAGSGKTTLIQHFNGLLAPDSGNVIVNGKDIFADKDYVAYIRKHIGVVFQFPEYQFFEENVFDEVAFGPKNLGWSRNEIRNSVEKSLKMVGLDSEKYLRRSPFTLSGGEKRRVAIASILSMEPDVLIMDEPTVGLDPASAKIVENIMVEYYNSGRTVIFVSHNMDLVSRISHKIIVLNSGKKVFEGKKEELLVNEILLRDAGLCLPEVYKFMKNLQADGFNLNPMVFTVKDAKREMKACIKRIDSV